MESNNIYIKLMDVRVKFSKLNLKKSGENKFANF
ncbi:putative phage essential recombination function domain protein, partial [Clostridioides difficile DA00189]